MSGSVTKRSDRYIIIINRTVWWSYGVSTLA
jgi:hypothetical protein